MGSFYIERHPIGDTLYYILESNVEINLLFTKHRVTYTSLTYYINDTLAFSKVQAVENGVLDKLTTTRRTSFGYHVEKITQDDTERYNIFHRGITFSSSHLFYNKPSPKDTSYAELYGNFGYLKATSNSSYEVINLATGSVTEYFYDDRIYPYKRKIEYPILNFVMYFERVLPVYAKSSEVVKSKVRFLKP